jgi:hypothetical protein
MGREIRRVPPDWQHPKALKYVPNHDWREAGSWVETDDFQPLYDQDYGTEAQAWLAEFDQWRSGTHPEQDADIPYFWDYSSPPAEERYRQRKWTAEEATHYQIYETVTEGTPVSPIFASLDDMIEWLVEGQVNSRPAAEAFARMGWAPTMLLDMKNGVLLEGIESTPMGRKGRS